MSPLPAIPSCRPGPRPARTALGGLRSALILACLLAGCSGKKETPTAEPVGAREIFEETVRVSHLPSAEATGARRTQLLQQAAAGYQRVLNEHPNDAFWAAQALRNLAAVRAAQTNWAEALRLYAEVAERYPGESFEVLQAWKAAADLLWDLGRAAEARSFDRRIIERFAGTNQPPLIQTVVKACQRRLASPASEAR